MNALDLRLALAAVQTRLLALEVQTARRNRFDPVVSQELDELHQMEAIVMRELLVVRGTVAS